MSFLILLICETNGCDSLKRTYIRQNTKLISCDRYQSYLNNIFWGCLGSAIISVCSARRCCQGRDFESCMGNIFHHLSASLICYMFCLPYLSQRTKQKGKCSLHNKLSFGPCLCSLNTTGSGFPALIPNVHNYTWIYNVKIQCHFLAL